jgi:hypothetical protein
MRIEPTSELISAYVDGELTADERAVVEQAMRDDSDVRRMHDELRALRFTLKSMPRYEPEQDLTERIMRQAERTMLGGAGAKSPDDDRHASTITSPSIAPTMETDGRVWPSWSVAVSVIGTLAALLLLVLWLPNSLQRFDVARSTAPGEAAPMNIGESVEAESLREESFERRLNRKAAALPTDDRDYPLSEAADEMPRDEALGDRGLGRALGMEGAKVGEAIPAPATTEYRDFGASDAPSSMPKDGDKKDGFYFQSQSPSGNARGGIPTEPKAATFGAGYGDDARRFDIMGASSGTTALQFSPADKEQLINRLNSDQFVYVELNVSNPEVRYARDLSVHWLEDELKSFQSDKASVKLRTGVSQAEKSLSDLAGNAVTDDQLSFSGEVLVAEGSAEQIRAALTTLSGMEGVEVKLASAPATTLYDQTRRSLDLGLQPAPDATRPAPTANMDADYGSTAEFKGQPSIGKLNKPAMLPAAPSQMEEQVSRDQRPGRRQRRGRGAGMDAGQAGREMPGAGGAYGGGGTLAGDAPAAAATVPPPRSGPATSKRSETDELRLKTADSEQELEKGENVAQGMQQVTQAAAEPAKNAKGIEEPATPPAAQADGGTDRGAARLQGKAIAGQAVRQRGSDEKEVRTLGESPGNAASAGELSAPAEKPAAESIVEVAKPRLVRILFRVIPRGEASATQDAAPADAAPSDETPDQEK